MLCFTVPYTIFSSLPDIIERVAMDPESVHTGVCGVAMVTLHSKFYYVVGYGVFNAPYISCFGVFNWKVLYGCTIRIIHVVAKKMRFRIQLTMETL